MSGEREDQKHRAEFVANLPPIKSAVLMSGNGEGGQIKLDVSESEYTKIHDHIRYWREANLRVTIEVDDGYGYG